MHILGIFLFILIAILFVVLAFGLSVVGFVLRLLGWGGNRQGTQERRSQVRSESSAQSPSKPRHFADGEGEYVDFEEVRPNDEPPT